MGCGGSKTTDNEQKKNLVEKPKTVTKKEKVHKNGDTLKRDTKTVTVKVIKNKDGDVDDPANYHHQQVTKTVYLNANGEEVNDEDLQDGEAEYEEAMEEIVKLLIEAVKEQEETPEGKNETPEGKNDDKREGENREDNNQENDERKAEGAEEDKPEVKEGQ